MTDDHSCVKEKDFAVIDGRIAILEKRDERFERTIEKLNETQERLVTEMASLHRVFNVVKYILSISIALFGGIFVFLMVEIIKIIH